MGKAENSVFKACEDACQWYHVPFFRINSGTIPIPDSSRPSGIRQFRAGIWKDALGESHKGGMADGLAQPKINCGKWIADIYGIDCERPYRESPYRFCVPLWIETKAKTGQRAEQVNFQKYVESCGAYYLLCRDSADPLLEWFKEHGVTR